MGQTIILFYLFALQLKLKPVYEQEQQVEIWFRWYFFISVLLNMAQKEYIVFNLYPHFVLKCCFFPFAVHTLNHQFLHYVPIDKHFISLDGKLLER